VNRDHESVSSSSAESRQAAGQGARLLGKILFYIVVLPTIVILAAKWAFGV
jgi:hypothetical protein